MKDLKFELALINAVSALNQLGEKVSNLINFYLKNPELHKSTIETLEQKIELEKSDFSKLESKLDAAREERNIGEIKLIVESIEKETFLIDWELEELQIQLGGQN